MQNTGEGVTGGEVGREALEEQLYVTREVCAVLAHKLRTKGVVPPAPPIVGESQDELANLRRWWQMLRAVN